MKQENNEEFTSDSISKYWGLLNYSNNLAEKQIANEYFAKLKEKCPNYLEISIELFFKSNLVQDKIISTLLIYLYIKENNNNFLKNESFYNKTKDFLINKALNSIINESEKNIFENSENNLIIERICYSISLILILGCISFWPEAVDEMLKFGKQTIKHTYLITIIFGNCYDEIININVNKTQENKIKEKFVEKKDEFKSFINTIIINSNEINKKLYNKTIILAKNLVFFEVNTLLIPNMIKIILTNINGNNIDSFTKLITKCIEYSKSKKLEDEIGGMDFSEYDKMMNKEELLSITYIIEYISLYISNNNKLDKDIIFGLGTILSEILENYIYLLFKKDILSQKLLNLFFFFITNESRIVSQLFFESLLILKNFINACYRFSNYNQNEKVEFSNYLLKICQKIIINCKYKKIENNNILLNGDNIKIQYNKEENNINNNIDDNNDENILNEIDEISINSYRDNAEDAIFNIFLIFANNFLKEGVNYFFEFITKDTIPLLKLNIGELTNEQILTIESMIFAIKSIVNCFENLMADKTPLIKLIIFLMRSQIINNDFIFSKFLLLLEEASTFFDYDDKIYSEIISFFLNQIELRINIQEQKNLIQLATTVLLSICESSKEIYKEDLWNTMLSIYQKYYDYFNELSLYNFTESICSSLIPKNDETDDLDDIIDDDSEEEIKNNFDIKKDSNYIELSIDIQVKNFLRVVETPLIQINNISKIINNKNDSNIYGNKEKEELLKKQIIKNFGVLTRILKQSSFIEDKTIINKIFDFIYTNSFKDILLIMNEYKNDNEIIKYIIKMITKSSGCLNFITINKIFNQLNELMINIFMFNNENYQSIYVLKNLYLMKLKNLNNKTIDNKDYIEILDNFLKINRQLCTSILSHSPELLELIQCLTIFFSNIFPYLKSLRTDDHIIIIDTLIIFIEGIKTISDNNIIKNILTAFTSLINSKKIEIINAKFSDILKATFYGLEHYNNATISFFNVFCFACISYDKSLFLQNLKEILGGANFNFLKEKYKNGIIDYFDYYSNNINKLKSILVDLMNISKKIYTQEVLDSYISELKFQKKDYLRLKNVKNIVVLNQDDK